jgi:50S ribosomal protein L16 3-hydroxylase
MASRKKTAHLFLPPTLDTLLGGLSPRDFLKDYWQKKPLLVRQAVPGFGALIDRNGLLELACRDDAESRLVRQSRGRWQVEYGPQSPEAIARLPKRDWTVLVQGVNQLVPEADALMRTFNFIPYARLDDLMVSFAPAGGGVGPHFDSYDVFLIQGIGRRRWEIGTQQDKSLVPNAPLRILKNFQPEETWDLEPGDMLYLPPQYAHNGVALSDCMTWSVGFRAYPAQDIAMQFLSYLQDNLEINGVYADPEIEPTRRPGKIPARMLKQFTAMLRAVRWSRRDIEHFIGAYLSEPKPNVCFDPPQRPPAFTRFTAQAQQQGLQLDLRSSLLYRKRSFYMNGERVEVTREHMPTLRRLADERRLEPGFSADESLLLLLHEWLSAGYLAVPKPIRRSN